MFMKQLKSIKSSLLLLLGLAPFFVFANVSADSDGGKLNKMAAGAIATLAKDGPDPLPLPLPLPLPEPEPEPEENNCEKEDDDDVVNADSEEDDDGCIVPLLLLPVADKILDESQAKTNPSGDMGAASGKKLGVAAVIIGTIVAFSDDGSNNSGNAGNTPRTTDGMDSSASSSSSSSTSSSTTSSSTSSSGT